MGVFLGLTFLYAIIGKGIDSNFPQDKIIPDQELLILAGGIQSETEFHEDGNVTFSDYRDSRKIIKFLKESLRYKTINRLDKFSCFKDGKPSYNYVEFMKSEIKVLREYLVGLDEEIEIIREEKHHSGHSKDRLKSLHHRTNQGLTRSYIKKSIKRKKVISKKCYVTLERPYRFSDFIRAKPSSDEFYSVTSERYID